MSYDETRGCFVLFGGNFVITLNNYPYVASGVLSDTWEFNGTSWAQVASTGPAPGIAAMAYDSDRGVSVLVGEGPSPSASVATWEWNGSTWTNLNLPGPSNRTGHRIAYDSWRRRMVLFGGSGTAADIATTYELGSFDFSPYGAPCAGSAASPQLGVAPSSQSRVGQNLILRFQSLPTGSSTVTPVVGFSNTSWNGIPLPMDLAWLGMPGCYLHTAGILGNPASSVSNQADVTIAVPSDPSIAGLTLFFQGLVLDPLANVAGFTTTNGGVVTFRL